MWELARDLAVITGMDEVRLQASAGAQGEMVGLLMARAYHLRNGENRHRVIIPDSSHGTNPATVALCGFEPVTIKSNEQGLVDPEVLAQVMSDDVACIMLTNPNTLGLFERDIVKIAKIVHDKGGLLYNDGANTNALLGLARAGDMGFDMMHLNLHKTFSTPHGGGGPAADAVGAKSHLAAFLPGPRVVRKTWEGEATVADPERSVRTEPRLDTRHRFVRETPGPESIGSVHPFMGNFAVLVRAFSYIRAQGAEGLAQVNALKNAVSMVVGFTTVVAFALFGPVHWVAVAVLVPATMLGGYAGARLARLLSPTLLRAVIVTVGLAAGIALLVAAR